MILSSMTAAAKFNPQRFEPVVLAQSDRSKTMLVCLEPGQAIPVHSPGVDLTLTILQGQATVVAGEDELAQAGPGVVVHADAGQKRGIRAEQRTIALVVVAPAPTQEDHREVSEHMKKGTWR